MKITMALLILIIISHSVLAQSDNQSSSELCQCEFMVLCAFPQLLAGKNISFTEILITRAQAMKEGFILDNGKIVNKEAFTKLIFKALGRTELALHFGAKPPERAALAGYILEIANNNERHFVLTGLDKAPLYNYCNVTGFVVSTQEVYVYAK